MFKQLGILKIEDIFNLKQLTFYHKFISNNLPKPIAQLLVSQTRELRSCHTAYFLEPPPKANTESAKKCLRYSIPDFINSYDQQFIINTSSLSILSIKNQFRKRTIDGYIAECLDPTCYACSSRFFNPFGFA